MAANERICLGCNVSDKSSNRTEQVFIKSGRSAFKKWEIIVKERLESMDMAAVAALVEERFDGRSCLSSYK